jgi:putative solute:sodium symporter small subunit
LVGLFDAILNAMSDSPNPTSEAAQVDRLGPLRTGLLVVWALSSFGVMYFAHSLQAWVGNWPLTYWLAAQGIVVGFVILVSVYAVLANRVPQADEV